MTFYKESQNTMNLIKILIALLSAVTFLHAEEPPQYRVNLTLEGMNAKWLSDLSEESRSKAVIKGGVMPLHHQNIRPSQIGTLQKLAEVTIGSAEPVLCGVIAEFTVVASDNGVILAGRTSLKRKQQETTDAKSTFATFESLEATFSGAIPLGKPTLIAAFGEGKDRTSLLATVIAIDATGKPIKN